MLVLIPLAFALSLDSLRAGFGLGASGLRMRRQVELAVMFMLCDGSSPLLGAGIGRALASQLGAWGDHLGPLLLLGYGLYVLTATRWAKAADGEASWIVLGLPVSLSLDNFVAGTTLGMIGLPWLVCGVVMGTTSGLMAIAGLQSGRLTQRILHVNAELFGGIAIVVIALSLVAWP